MHGTGYEGEAQSERRVGKRQRSARAGVTECWRAGAVDTMLVGHETDREGGLIDENPVGPVAEGGPHRGKGFVTEERRVITAAEERVEPGEGIGGGDRPERREGRGAHGWRVHHRGREHPARFAQGSPGQRGGISERLREWARGRWRLGGENGGRGIDQRGGESKPEIETERCAEDPFPVGAERLAGHASDNLVEQEAEGAGSVPMAAIGWPVRRLRRERGRHRFMLGDRQAPLIDRREAGLMREQLCERDLVLASGGELRPEFCHGGVERDTPFLQGVQGAGRGDALAGRPDQTGGLGGPGPAGRGLATVQREQWLSILPDGERCSPGRPAGGRLVHDGHEGPRQTVDDFGSRRSWHDVEAHAFCSMFSTPQPDRDQGCPVGCAHSPLRRLDSVSPGIGTPTSGGNA